MPTLFRDLHLVIERYGDLGFIRLARTAEPIHTLSHVAGSLAGCKVALAGLRPEQLGILIDWRLYPVLRAEEALEAAAIRGAAQLATAFARRAVLLLGPSMERSGELWSSAGAQLFQDEEAALAHVWAR